MYAVNQFSVPRLALLHSLFDKERTDNRIPLPRLEIVLALMDDLLQLSAVAVDVPAVCLKGEVLGAEALGLEPAQGSAVVGRSVGRDAESARRGGFWPLRRAAPTDLFE